MSPHSAKAGALRSPKIIKPPKAFFEKRQGILLAFLFGSAAGKRMGPSSDVDVGALFETIPAIDTMNDLVRKLSTILQREEQFFFGTDYTDVTDISNRIICVFREAEPVP